MTNQPCAPHAVRSVTLAALLLCVVSGTVARAQDLVASTTPLATTPDRAVATPPSAATSPVRLDRTEQETFLLSAPIRGVRGVKVGVTGTHRAALSAGNV